MNRRSFLKAASLALPTMAGCSSRSVPEFSAQTFNPQSGAIHAIAYSPDGSQIATAHSSLEPSWMRTQYIGIPQGYVRLWSADEHFEKGTVAAEKLGRLPMPHFASNGDVIVLADGAIVLCDNIGSVKERRPSDRVQLVDALRERLVCGIGEEPSCVVVTDFHGQPLSKELRHPKGKSISPVYWRGMSLDGKLLATVPFPESSEVLIWDWETGTIRKHFEDVGVQTSFWRTAFASDSKSVAIINSSHKLSIHDIETGRLQQSFEYRDGLLVDFCFSPNSQRIAVCGEGSPKKNEKPFGFIKIWDVSTGAVITDLKRPDVWGVTAIAFSPDGRTLSAGLGDGQLVAYARV